MQEEPYSGKGRGTGLDWQPDEPGSRIGHAAG